MTSNTATFAPTVDANATLPAEEETTATRLIGSRFKSVFPMAEIPEADGRPTSMGGVVGGSDALVDLYKVIDRVADRSGFGTATLLRHHFRRVIGVTPSDYRRRFACGGSEAGCAATA